MKGKRKIGNDMRRKEYKRKQSDRIPAAHAAKKKGNIDGDLKASYLVEHTADFLKFRAAIRLSMMMMQLWGPHIHRTSDTRSRAGWRVRHRAGKAMERAWPTRRHVWRSRGSRYRLASAQFGLATNSSAAQSRVLIAVPPAIDGTLD